MPRIRCNANLSIPLVTDSDQEDQDLIDPRDIHDPYQYMIVFEIPENDDDTDEDDNDGKTKSDDMISPTELGSLLGESFMCDHISDYKPEQIKHMEYLPALYKWAEGTDDIKRTVIQEHMRCACIELLHILCGFETYQFRSRDNDEIFVKIYAHEETLRLYAEATGFKCQLKPEIEPNKDFRQYLPFIPYKASYQSFLQTYKNEAGVESYFRASDQLVMTSAMITEHIDVGFMCNQGMAKEAMCLHNEFALSSLKAKWGSLKLFSMFQPIAEVRNYYGEKIAMYFCWLGFYSRWLIPLAFMGVVTVVASWIVFPEGSKPPSKMDVGEINWPQTFNAAFSLVLACWAAVFCEFWNREGEKLATSWGTKECKEIEPPRPEFKGERRINPINERMERYYPRGERSLKQMISFSASSLVVGLVIIIVVEIFFYRNAYPSQKVVAGIVNAIQIQVFNIIYGKMAVKLTDWENHRTASEYEDALILKIFLFQFVNSYNTLFVLAFIQPYIDKANQIEEDYMSILGLQLAIIFFTGFAMNAVELGKPFIKSWLDKRAEEKGIAEQKKKEDNNLIREEMFPSEANAKLEPYEGTLEDYLELVIQFGFVILFCSAFPLTPLFALLNNIYEIRIDAFKLCWLSQRPIPLRAEDIGTWSGIVKVMSILGVVTNLALIVFTANIVNLDVNGSVGYLYKFGIFVAIEHIVFIVKLGVLNVVDPISPEVQDIRRRHDFLIKKYVYKNASEIESLETQRDIIPPRHKVHDHDLEDIVPFGKLMIK
mmetsp:Transcript_245/g.266  ORF Transcript_245/g.266 Transcript_245/m.266 type:complete len:770 (-) Transcript_245:224-2533(-)